MIQRNRQRSVAARAWILTKFVVCITLLLVGGTVAAFDHLGIVEGALFGTTGLAALVVCAVFLWKNLGK